MNYAELKGCLQSFRDATKHHRAEKTQASADELIAEIHRSKNTLEKDHHLPSPLAAHCGQVLDDSLTWRKNAIHQQVADPHAEADWMKPAAWKLIDRMITNAEAVLAWMHTQGY